MASTDLVYIADHPTRAARRLLGQDWDKPRIVALAEALGVATQTLEDATFDLIVGRQLDAATGAQLDQWGVVVGERRGVLGDADYRRFIRARILANICGGTPDELITIWSILMEPADVRYLPMFPAGYQLQAVRREFLGERMRRRVRRLMEDIKPAGVTMALIEAVEGYLGFDANPVAKGYNVGKLARVL